MQERHHCLGFHNMAVAEQDKKFSDSETLKIIKFMEDNSQVIEES